LICHGNVVPLQWGNQEGVHHAAQEKSDKRKGSSRIATPNVKQSKQTNYEMQKAIICTPLWIRTTHQLHISNGALKKWEGKPNTTAELNRRSVWRTSPNAGYSLENWQSRLIHVSHL